MEIIVNLAFDLSHQQEQEGGRDRESAATLSL